MAQDLAALFERCLDQKKFFKARERILIACSGGPDSVALFHLLNEMAPSSGWKLGLLHFNHQLRPGAKRDEAFVRRLARDAKVPFFVGRGNVAGLARKEKISLEEAARKMRYAFFLRTARTKKFSKIALAHTRDDQAETILMRMLQGTGTRGLLGVREQIVQGRVTIVRPVLAFTKEVLGRYLRDRHLSCCSDESNDHLSFLRNRIRLKLMPRLRRDFNPRVTEALSRIPAIVAEESELLDELQELAWRKVLKRAARGSVEFRRVIFLKFPRALQYRMINRAVRKINPKSGLDFEAWERLRAGLTRSRCRFSLPKDVDFELTPKKVMIYRKKLSRNPI